MKPRREAVRMIERQLSGEQESSRYSLFHYGIVELRDLMDFIYGGPPKIKQDELNPDWRNR